MSRSPRILGLAAAAALALAAVPSIAAAKAPVARIAHPSHTMKINLPLPSSLGAGRGHGLARTASVSNAWFGSGAECVGTAVSLSVGRQFGLAPGTNFAWRSRLYMYNPRTGVTGYSNYGPWIYDQITTDSYILPDGTFVMGATGGVNPAPAPTSVWTVSHGWYVTPYVQVSGVAERSVNFDSVFAPDSFAQPNWCYVA
jgi:hypothetical protein